MLKSTHKPTAPTPLPVGWTEHKAPAGHIYYYNAATKQSTYTRPSVPQAPVLANPPALLTPSQSFLQYQAVDNTNGPGSLFQTQFNGDIGRPQNYGARDGGNTDWKPRPKPQPLDKPKSKYPIPGFDPWILVNTKYGRRFVYNPEKDQSFWRIPEKLKPGILALDQQRIREKAESLVQHEEEKTQGAAARPILEAPEPEHNGEAEDSSEYEEVEVTDDEDEENPAKRQKTDDTPDGPVEFNEDDIAFQLAAMGQEYGLDPGEYDDGNMEQWEEGAGGVEITHEDSAALFKDLLDDFGINPYSPWEKLVEEGKLVDDLRYTALTSMKARKEVWEAWSRDRIKVLREVRAKEEKKDPTIPYLAFLQKHATPKLYWPEFRRKYKKEQEMRDTSLGDKEREKMYREHINRLKLPASTLKSDVLNLLKAQPLSVLNNATLPSHLPPSIISSVIFISLDPSIRDPLVESYISTLGPPPENVEDEESEEAAKERKDKDRRQRALEERERKVSEEKRRQRRDLEFGKGRLREEEAEIARAMNVTKKGLMGHLEDDTMEINNGDV